jgi:hypothetical protein
MIRKTIEDRMITVKKSLSEYLEKDGNVFYWATAPQWKNKTSEKNHNK